MSAVEIDALAGADDFTRDRWGRPLIIPAKGGKAVAYQRASSAAKPIEDTFNLEQWHRRNVAFGVASDPSLVARVLAIGGSPQTWSSDDKKAINGIVEAANVAAKAHAAADTGTALHALIEKVNRGEDPGNVGQFAADIKAYRRAIADTGWEIEPRLVEVRMVCDALKMAGTCDLLVWSAEDQCYYVADLKTGSSVEYATLSHAAQIATYAHSDLYDIATGRRSQLAINTDVGYVIHLPAGRGECHIYEINLVAGFKAAKLANSVRSTRTEAKKWATPISSTIATDDEPQFDTRTDREYNLRDRVQALVDAGHAKKLTWRWPEGVPTFKSADIFTAEQLDRIEQAVVHAEADGEMPFRPAPSTPTTPEPVEPVAAPQTIDEGDDVDDATYAGLEQRFAGLDEASGAWLREVAVDARDAGHPISVSQRRSRRRVEITRALLAWAALDCDDDLIRQLLRQVTDSDIPIQPGVTVGAVVGQLTLAQAVDLALLLEGLVDGTAVAVFSDTGLQIQTNQEGNKQ